MVQIIQQGDPWGRVGGAFGEGFGEGASGQIERNMLSSGLEKLARGKENVHPETGEKTYTPYSPVELLARGYRLPGFAENAGTFLPALQTGAYQKGLEARAKKGTVAPAEAAQVAPQEQVAGAAPAVVGGKEKPQEVPKKRIAPGRQGEGFATKEERQAIKSSLLREPTDAELAAKESEVFQRGVSDPAKVREAALDELKRTPLAIRANEEDFTKRMGTKAEDLLGKELQPGLKDALVEEGLFRIRKGKTSDEVIGEMSPMMEDIAKAKTQIQNTAGDWYSWPKDYGAKLRAYKEQEKIFDNYGLREQFLDLVKKEQTLTYIQTAQDLDELQNSNIKKTIKSLPVRPEGIALLNEKNLKAIIDNIKPEDNLLAIAGELRDKNYSVKQFLDEAGKISGRLEPEQQRQLQKPESNSQIGDVFWRAFK